MRLVSETVELGADLPDLGNDDLLIAAAFVRCGAHDGALHGHIETPGRGADERHRATQRLPELDDLPGLDQLYLVEHGLRLHVIAGTPLVAGAPFRGAAHAVGGRRPRRRLGCSRSRPDQQGRNGEGEWHAYHWLLPT